MEVADRVMKIKLDENLSGGMLYELPALGHDVESAQTEGIVGVDDVRVANIAREEGRILLTMDVEFGDLRKHPPGQHPGITLFRPYSRGPGAMSRFVLRFMSEAHGLPITGAVVVVDPGRTRIRLPEAHDNAPPAGQT